MFMYEKTVCISENTDHVMFMCKKTDCKLFSVYDNTDHVIFMYGKTNRISENTDRVMVMYEKTNCISENTDHVRLCMRKRTEHTDHVMFVNVREACCFLLV